MDKTRIEISDETTHLRYRVFVDLEEVHNGIEKIDPAADDLTQARAIGAIITTVLLVAPNPVITIEFV